MCLLEHSHLKIYQDTMQHATIQVGSFNIVKMMYTDVTIVKLSPEDTEHVDIKPTIRPSIIVPPLTS